MNGPLIRQLPAQDVEDLQQRVGGLWRHLDGGRILMTGCTGFFGAWMVEGMLAAVKHRGLSVEVVLLTRSCEDYRLRMPHVAGHPSVQLLEGDVRTFEAPPGSFTHLVLGATTPSAALNLESPRLMIETIIEGTRRTLDVASKAGVRHALLLSSGAVYGPQPPDLVAFPETFGGAPDPLSRDAAYGLGKRLAEYLCGLMGRDGGMVMRIARCFAFLGPHQPLGTHQAAASFLGDALAGRPIGVQGDGTAIRSWLYGKDLAWWLWTILLDERAGPLYNVGSDEVMDIAGFARLVGRIAGQPVRIAALPEPGRPAHRYVPDVSRARNELGLEVSVPLVAAVQRTLQWNLA